MTTKLTLTRELAIDTFILAMYDKQRPEIVMERLLREHGSKLKKQDKALFKEIVYGSLRWYKKIYWILQNITKRDLEDSPREVRGALIIGTYQMFFLDKIPDRAAVNESVEYVRKKGHAKAVSFTNGILRQVARRSQYFAKPDKNLLPLEYLSLQYSHPEWIVNRWLQRYRYNKTEEIVAANNKQPPYTIRLNSLKVNLDESLEFQKDILRSEKIQTNRSPLKGCFYLSASPSFEEDSLFQQGYFTIQDQSSQLIPYLVDPQEGEFVIDTCCGPGGKLSHVYELGKGTIELLGIEKNPGQMQKAKETMERLDHQKVEWLETDFLDFKPAKAPDKIMMDAPCSGLGVLRRHPEGKWHKDENLVFKMAELQKKFIQHGIEILKVGGVLVYSVCSFENEESIDQLNWVKKQFKDQIEILSPVQFLPDYFKSYVTRDNILLVYSGNKEKADGFSSFVLKKIK